MCVSEVWLKQHWLVVAADGDCDYDVVSVSTTSSASAAARRHVHDVPQIKQRVRQIVDSDTVLEYLFRVVQIQCSGTVTCIDRSHADRALGRTGNYTYTQQYTNVLAVSLCYVMKIKISPYECQQYKKNK